MFTWICQKCGSEVPPSETDCPNCRVKASQTVTAPPAQAPPPQFQAPPQAPPVQTQPVQTQYVPPAPPPPPIAPRPESLPAFASAPPVTRKATSPALVAAGSAVGILALLAVLYLYVLPSKTDTTAESPSAALESPGATGSAGSAAVTTTHPLAKYIEIAGIRIIEEGKGQVKIAYLVVNHSPADLPELQAQVSLGAAGKTMFEFPANIPSIGPYESKDLSATIKTRLQPYEMPDWQKLIPVVRITSER